MEYVDLGLPSKILWASEDLIINNSPLIEFDDIPAKIQLPTRTNFEELIRCCTIVNHFPHYFEFIGINRNKLVLKASGWARPGEPIEDPIEGFYWSCDTEGGNRVCLTLKCNGPSIHNFSISENYLHSVRAVCLNNNNIPTIF